MNIKYLSLPKKLVLVSVVSVLMLLVFGISGASAQPAGSTESDTAADTRTEAKVDFIPERYEYSVEKSNNYTLLIRKSLQLYDRANDSVSLNEAQTVYAETNIAIDMEASDLIYAGNELTVNSGLVANYARQSQSLSQASQDAWQAYADNADLELDNIEAENVDVDERGRVVERAPADEDSSEASDSGMQAGGGDDEPDDSESNALWWLLGGLSVAGLWYLLWQRGSYEE